MDMQLLNPRCGSGHLMDYQRGKPPSYTSALCDKCRAPRLEHHTYFYHCKTCKYDLCRACILTSAQVVKTEMNILSHKHSVKLVSNYRGAARWACDMSRPELGGKCLSGIKRIGQAIGVQRWACEACGFDICLDCLLANMLVDPAKLD